MADPRNVVRLQMAALIDSLGGFEAAVEVLRARWGHAVSKGTLSKKRAGDLDWTVADVLAIEAAAGSFPVTGYLVRQMKEQGGGRVSGDLIALSGLISRETGEAVAAVLNVMSADTDADRAETIKEVYEAIDALKQVVQVLEGTG